MDNDNFPTWAGDFIKLDKPSDGLIDRLHQFKRNLRADLIRGFHPDRDTRFWRGEIYVALLKLNCSNRNDRIKRIADRIIRLAERGAGSV